MKAREDGAWVGLEWELGERILHLAQPLTQEQDF